MGFSALHKAFENKNTDLFLLQQQAGFSKYILVRSLDKSHLLKLIADRQIAIDHPAPKLDDFYQALYESDRISIDDLIEFIRDEYPKVRAARHDQEQYLPDILQGFSSVKCGVRNDNLNDLVSGLVRDKTIQSKQELDERVQALIQSNIQDYIYWQYYNQATSDLLEHLFNDHPRIIPTLRKIKYVDFLIQIDGKIIPFDLKVTHLSESYYDLLKTGLSENSSEQDDYGKGEAPSEIEHIKKFYKSVKAKYALPNYGTLTKIELLNHLKAIESLDPEIQEFLHSIEQSRAQLVQATKADLQKACWWNYKYQGERLFKNNNRFYVFLAYQKSFEDPRPLKGYLDEIKLEVNALLDQIQASDLMTIQYKYEKDKTYNGDYKVNALSVMFVQ